MTALARALWANDIQPTNGLTVKDEAVQTVYLHPGDCRSYEGNYSLRTILGSCVSVCLWDPFARRGGMNHFLLPECDSDFRNPLRYGETAVPALVQQLEILGSQPESLQAKIYGGASLLARHKAEQDQLGWRNVEAAKSALKKIQIPFQVANIGGSNSRKLFFNIQDGSTQVIEL